MKKGMERNTQQIRLLYLAIYIAFLFVINYFAFGVWIPSTSGKGFWFYSGAAALIFGSLLFTPYFVSPADAISYLVSAIIAILSFNVESTDKYYILPRNILLIFCSVLLGFSFISVILKDTRFRSLVNLAESCKIIVDKLGNPRFIYALLIIFALWEYHMDSPKEVFFISIAGIIISAQKPVEALGNIFRRVRDIWDPISNNKIIGTIVAIQEPNLVLLRQDVKEIINPGTCLLMSDQYSDFKLGLVLGSYGREESILLRAILIDVPSEESSYLSKVVNNMPIGSVSILDESYIDSVSLREKSPIFSRMDSFLGLVIKDTKIEKLSFEIYQERDIEQGRLVEITVRGKNILYQILDGITAEDIIQQKNTYGYAKAEAIQIGEWDEKTRRFISFNWIPEINTPVFLKGIEKQNDNKNAIGHFPSTSYQVEIKNINELVTHNTAILGILGVGKSMLAIELVERMIKDNIKIVCIDLTDQYSKELSDFYDQETEKQHFRRITDACCKGREAFNDSPERGGSINSLKEALFNDLQDFLRIENDNKLKIYNPAAFNATGRNKSHDHLERRLVVGIEALDYGKLLQSKLPE